MHAVEARKRLLPIKKVHKTILNYRKVKLIEIAETLKISKERVDVSEQFLAIFNLKKDEL
jgi:hypothetical protein